MSDLDEAARSGPAELEMELMDDMPFETFSLYRSQGRSQTKGLSYFQKLIAKD